MLVPLGTRSRATKFAASVLTSMILATGAAFAQQVGLAVEQDEPKIFDDLNLPTYVWNIPKEKPKAIIMGFHGGCLHGRSYKTLANSLANNDIMFVSFDMRGFGKWFHEGYGTKRDRPFDHGQSVRDGKLILERLREKYPGVPIFGMGESFGAFMAMQEAELNPQLMDGLILVSNSNRMRFFLSPYMLVQVVQSLTNPLRRFDLSYYLKRRISHNKQACLQEVNDPLNRNDQSIAELIRSGYSIWKIGRHAKDIPRNLPVLCVNGELDKLCRPKAARKIFDKIPSVEKEYVEVENHGHLLVETPYMEPRVKNLITNWIEDVAAQKVAGRGLNISMQTVEVKEMH